MSNTQLSSNQLRQALQLSEQIESLQQRLNSILSGGGSSASSESATGGSSLKGRKMSPATLRKMRAAQQARWTKIKGDQASSAESANATKAPTRTKKGSGMTPEQKARISAALKARWAAKKKGESAANPTQKRQATG